jgi:hypothetical protein
MEVPTTLAQRLKARAHELIPGGCEYFWCFDRRASKKAPTSPPLMGCALLLSRR